jgi:ABC-2 type transport system permease protein
VAPGHAWLAFVALASREVVRFCRQTGRLISAVVRPSLWLLVFAVGLGGAFSLEGVGPYPGPVDYEVWLVPGLLGMVLLFNGMQSSLAMVYDREMGMMRLLLTAPLPRWYLLACKLAAGTLLSLLQAYAFLVVCALAGVDLPAWGWLSALPALALAGLMLGAFGLLLSVHVRQLENFAGTMNFVIFPMFFLSTALYPLWRMAESSTLLRDLCAGNPFTHAVELIRFALYAQLNAAALGWTALALAVFMGLAVWGFDPARGMMARKAG